MASYFLTTWGYDYMKVDIIIVIMYGSDCGFKEHKEVNTIGYYIWYDEAMILYP